MIVPHELFLMILFVQRVLLGACEVVALAVVITTVLHQRTNLINLLLHRLQLQATDGRAYRCPVQLNNFEDGVPLNSTNLLNFVDEQQKRHTLEMQYAQEELNIA